VRKVKRWRASEIVAYLEDRILSNTATKKETEVYEEYAYNGSLNKANYSLKAIIKRMNREYNGL
jgi:hypothetical protein